MCKIHDLETLFRSAERMDLLALTLHEHLLNDGNVPLAREAWVLHLDAIQSREALEDALGMEPLSPRTQAALPVPRPYNARVDRLRTAARGIAHDLGALMEA